jgi:hypothetical protein
VRRVRLPDVSYQIVTSTMAPLFSLGEDFVDCLLLGDLRDSRPANRPFSLRELARLAVCCKGFRRRYHWLLVREQRRHAALAKAGMGTLSAAQCGLIIAAIRDFAAGRRPIPDWKDNDGEVYIADFPEMEARKVFKTCIASDGTFIGPNDSCVPFKSIRENLPSLYLSEGTPQGFDDFLNVCIPLGDSVKSIDVERHRGWVHYALGSSYAGQELQFMLGIILAVAESGGPVADPGFQKGLSVDIHVGKELMDKKWYEPLLPVCDYLQVACLGWVWVFDKSSEPEDEEDEEEEGEE